MTNKGIIKKIVEAADIGPSDAVLEIGPGTGALTEEIAKRAGKLIAVEKDKRLVEVLKERFKDFKNVEIIEGDALKFEFQNPDFEYKVVANIPYYITSYIIRKFLEAQNKPKEMVLMVQKEVAKRICAKPPDMNLLAVSVQFYGTGKILFNVSKNNFYPVPKVDSSLIKITPETTGLNNNSDFVKTFFKIVKAGFSSPRKQILNNFCRGLKTSKKSASLWLEKNGISPQRRAQTLSMEEWIKLASSCGLLECL